MDLSGVPLLTSMDMNSFSTYDFDPEVSTYIKYQYLHDDVERYGANILVSGGFDYSRIGVKADQIQYNMINQEGNLTVIVQMKWKRNAYVDPRHYLVTMEPDELADLLEIFTEHGHTYKIISYPDYALNTAYTTKELIYDWTFIWWGVSVTNNTKSHEVVNLDEIVKSNKEKMMSWVKTRHNIDF